jgi:hypothetical protein
MGGGGITLTQQKPNDAPLRAWRIPCRRKGVAAFDLLHTAGAHDGSRAKRARSMKNTQKFRNFTRRPARPAAGNGSVQQVASRLLDLRGMVTAPQVVEYAYADRLLLNREPRHQWFGRHCRRVLERVGAVRIRRLPTIGRPWLWAMPQTPLDDRG